MQDLYGSGREVDCVIKCGSVRHHSTGRTAENNRKERREVDPFFFTCGSIQHKSTLLRNPEM